MAKSAMPLLLGLGAAALLLGTKKKKKSAPAPTPDFIPDENYEDDALPYIPDAAPAPKDSSKPSGNPPRGDTYDEAYWGASHNERLENIRKHFVFLGYPVDVIPYPMNILGPDGDISMPNYDNSIGKLGGGDDQPNSDVRAFQHDYNVVSRLNKAEKIYGQAMGGLYEDGLVGPFTLNGLRYAKEGLPGGKKWSDLVALAHTKGIA
jgi:hypothetical protein